MFFNFLIFIFALNFIKIFSQPSPFGFKVQLIGKSRFVSEKENNARNYCESIECLTDADILFTRASQYQASDPCMDFANFSLATAMDVGPPSERDRERSFMRGIHEKLMDRIRRALMEKVSKKDGKVASELKVTFKKFIKSDHALRHIEGHKEFVNYVQFLGGSPYLSRHLAWNPFLFDKLNDFGILRPKNSSALNMNLWDEKKFHYQNLIEHEPEHFLKFFFDLQLKRCKIPTKNSFKFDEILCLDTYSYITGFTAVATAFKATFENINYLYRMLETMNDYYVAGFYGKIELKEKMFDPAMKNFETFLNSRKKILDKYKESKPEVIKIGELKNISGNLKIDWLKLINSQLFDKYQVNEDDEILVTNLRLLQELTENLAKIPKSIAADFFVISFSFENNGIFEYHQDDELRKTWAGSKKSVQRWEIFTERLYMYMPTALLLMYDQKYGDEKLKRAAEEFVGEALQEAKKLFIKNTNLPLSVSFRVLSKLKNAKIICGFDERLMKNLTLDDFNKEMAKDGSSLLPNGKNRTLNYAEIKLFGRKIMTTPKDDERRVMTMQASYDWFEITKLVDDYKYDMNNENILFFPPKTLIYPFYHPNRPRFFNMATLFTRAIFSIQQGIKNYVIENFNIKNFTTGLENPIEIAYESYCEWLETHEDLQLGANLLTNRQLFWVARSVVEYRKLHRQLPLIMKILGKFLNDYSFQYDFQQSPGFLEAFKCNSPKKLSKSSERNEKLKQLQFLGFDTKDLERIFESYKFLG